jgi:hypothetical protein
VKLAWFLVLLSSYAAAEVRVEAHVGAGMEGGLISGVARPDGVSEYGGGVTWLGKRHGVGVVVERVGRLSHDLPTTSETKLDVVYAFRDKKRRFVAGVGAGLRKFEIVGEREPDRRGSTLWGVDVVRMQLTGRLARIGPVELGLYFAWTYCLVHGEVYGQRHGDMAYPVRDYWNFANSFVFGLATSFDTRP